VYHVLRWCRRNQDGGTDYLHDNYGHALQFFLHRRNTPFYSYTIFLRKKHDNLELLPDVVLKKIVEMVMK
jgi:hypothetical protein